MVSFVSIGFVMSPLIILLLSVWIHWAFAYLFFMEPHAHFFWFAVDFLWSFVMHCHRSWVISPVLLYILVPCCLTCLFICLFASFASFQVHAFLCSYSSWTLCLYLFYVFSLIQFLFRSSLVISLSSNLPLYGFEHFLFAVFLSFTYIYIICFLKHVRWQESLGICSVRGTPVFVFFWFAAQHVIHWWLATTLLIAPF